MRDWDNEHAPADENNDGKCDICGLTMGTSGGSTHTHTFTNKWVINADGKHCLMCDTAGCTQVKESHIASWTGLFISSYSEQIIKTTLCASTFSDLQKA